MIWSTAELGLQVVVNYVAMTPQGKVFDSSLEKGKPYDIRVGSGAVIPGLDEGIRGMKPGGIRRLYIPGNLAFPKVGLMLTFMSCFSASGNLAFSQAGFMLTSVPLYFRLEFWSSPGSASC